MSAAKLPVNRRTILAMGTGAAVALGLPGIVAASPSLQSISGRAFGTHWRITAPAGRQIGELNAEIVGLLGGIDRRMSPWRADSDLSRFNRSGTGDLVVAPETAFVASSALDLARASGGAFDPTVGPLVARWGFGPIEGDENPGPDRIAIDGRTISKRRDGVTLDLCGIAKGYALDRMADLLDKAGEEDFLIDLGGELAARGRHPSGRPWRAGVEDPQPESSGIAEVLRLKGRAVATSGSRANGYGIGDRRYSHIIDPRTREPVDGNLVSVSVVASDAMTADGWATALMAAGASVGPALARENGIAALFLMRDGRDLRRILTGTFGDHLS